MSVLEIPLDKKLTANCLVETRTKLGLLITAAMVDYSHRIQCLLWLQQSLIKWLLMVWFTLGHSQLTSVKCAKAVSNYKAGGSALKLICVFVFCFSCIAYFSVDGQQHTHFSPEQHVIHSDITSILKVR